MVDLDRLEQHFAARCRAVVRVPYDPHLEEGAEVDLEYLDAETADAYLTLRGPGSLGSAPPPLLRPVRPPPTGPGSALAGYLHVRRRLPLA